MFIGLSILGYFSQMKYNLLSVFVLSLFYFNSLGNARFTAIEARNNIRVDIEGNNAINNFGAYGYIFINILENFRQTLYDDSTFIYVDLQGVYPLNQESSYKLQYGEFEFPFINNKYRGYPRARHKGLKLSFNG